MFEVCRVERELKSAGRGGYQTVKCADIVAQTVHHCLINCPLDIIGGEVYLYEYLQQFERALLGTLICRTLKQFKPTDWGDGELSLNPQPADSRLMAAQNVNKDSSI